MAVSSETSNCYAWQRWPSMVGRVLDDHADAESRAKAIARALHEMAPWAEVTGCALTALDAETLAVEPAERALIQTLKKQLVGISDNASALCEVRLDVPPAARQGIAAPIVCGSRRWGWLVLGGARQSVQDAKADLEPCLALAASVLALRLELEELEQQRQALSAEQSASADLTTTGEALSGLVHELNNSLNSMLLLAAVVQMKVDPALKDEVAAIRNEGACAAARLGWILRHRERCRLTRSPVDLNRAVHEALADCPDLAARITLDCPGGQVIVAANPSALRRLLVCLFRALERIRTQPHGVLIVRTNQAGAERSLSVTGARWGGAAGASVDLFDVEADDLNSDLVLERMAMLSLARLVDATVRAALDADGAVSVAATWPPAPDGELRQDPTQADTRVFRRT